MQINSKKKVPYEFICQQESIHLRTVKRNYLRMKTRLILLLIVLVAQTGVNYGQKYFVTNQYVYDLFLMNPAAAGSDRNCYTFNGFYQKQWFGTDLAPTTQLFSFQAPIASNVGSGTYFYNDQNGFNKKMSLQQSFSSTIKLRENMQKITTLSFGLSAVVEQTSIDQSQFSGGMPGNDPAIGGASENGVGFNLNTGFILRSNKLSGGISVTNLLDNNNPMYDSEWEPKLPKTWHMFSSVNFKIPDRDLYVTPMVYYRINSQSDKRLDLNLKLDMPTMSSDFTFWGLLAYRRTMDTRYGKDLGIATTVGIIYRSLSVGLEHQLGTTSANRHYGSAMILVAGYRICNNRKNKAVECTEAANMYEATDKPVKKKKSLFKRK